MTFSLLWLHIVTCEAFVLCTHASQVTICIHNIENVLYSLYVSTFNQVCSFWLSTDCSSLMMVSL